MQGLSYDDVGYVDATELEPNGVLQRTKQIIHNQQTYTVDTIIRLVDDAENQSLTEGALNEQTADYKGVVIRVTWIRAGGNESEVFRTTRIAPGGHSHLCLPTTLSVCPGFVSPGEGACIPNTSCPSAGVCLREPVPNPSCPPSSQFCPQCYQDADCPADTICNTTTNTCESLPEACRSSDSCNEGDVCSNGVCTPACNSPFGTACAQGEICNEQTGVCTLPCTSNICSCAAGTACNTETQLCE